MYMYMKPRSQGVKIRVTFIKSWAEEKKRLIAFGEPTLRRIYARWNSIPYDLQPPGLTQLLLTFTREHFMVR